MRHLNLKEIVEFLLQIWKFFSNYVFKYFYTHYHPLILLKLLSFWESNYKYVRWLILFYRLLTVCAFIFSHFFSLILRLDNFYWLVFQFTISSTVSNLQSPLNEFTISDTVLFHYRIFIWFFFIISISLILFIISLLMFLLLSHWTYLQ